MARQVKEDAGGGSVIGLFAAAEVQGVHRGVATTGLARKHGDAFDIPSVAISRLLAVGRNSHLHPA